MELKSSLPYSQVPATCPYPEPTLYRLLTFRVPKKMSLFLLRDTFPRNTPPRRSEWGSSLPPDCFVSRGSISPCEFFLTMFFHGEALLALCPTPKLEEHPSSAVRDCLFNIFAATLHIGGRSSIRNLRTRRAMVTGTHLPRAQLFLQWEMLQTNFEKIETHIWYSITFFLKWCHLWDNVEKYCRARQVTCGNVIWCMPFTWWVTKATDTHSECVILFAFPLQQWLHKCTSILPLRTLPALFHTGNFFVGWCCSTWQRPSYRDQAGKWSRRSTCEQNWECCEDHTSANRWKLNLVLGDNEANFSIWN